MATLPLPAARGGVPSLLMIQLVLSWRIIRPDAADACRALPTGGGGDPFLTLNPRYVYTLSFRDGRRKANNIQDRTTFGACATAVPPVCRKVFPLRNAMPG